MRELLTVVLGLALLQNPLAAQSRTPNQNRPIVVSTRLKVQVEIENPIAPVNAPVMLYVQVKNVSSKLLIGPRLGEVIVTDQAGTPIPLPTENDRSNLPTGPRDVLGLDPGQSARQAVDIAALFHLTQPGTYSVQVIQPVWAETGENERGVSNITTFTIVPADSSLLKTGPEAGLRSMAHMFPGDVSAPLQIEFETSYLSINAGEPVVAGMVLHNLALAPVKIDDLSTEQTAQFRVSVTRPNGERVDMFAPIAVFNNPPVSGARIDAQQSHKERIILTKWVAFDEPGLYKIALFIPEAADPAILEVSVGRRDLEHLEKVCADLVQQADRDHVFALMVLSTIHDPIAARCARPYMNEDTGVEALAGIGTPEAVSALAEVARGTNAKLADQAKWHLRDLRDHAKESAVKQAAEAALK